MEFLQLQYFFESARTENFAKTAEKFFVPPSSVSASVKRLEAELGCKLFDRHSNKITLNENGRKLQRSLGIVFDELEHVKAEFKEPSLERTKIKLLVRSIRDRITQAIIDYHKDHPNVCFETVFDMAESDLNDYDLIIDEQNDSYVGYKKFELCSIRVRIKASADNPLCNRTITMSQLRNQPFITIGDGSNLHKILMRVCKNAGFSPNIVMTTNDAQCYAKCITEGMGIGLGKEGRLPLSPNSRISYLYVTDFEERQNFYGYYKPNESKIHIQDFINFLRCRNF